MVQSNLIMISNSDKSKYICNDILWFIRIFFGFNRALFFFILILLFFSSNIFCQCPDNNFFKAEINSIYTSQTKKPESQLGELLQLLKEMKVCHLAEDSSFMYLLQKIGGTYYKLSNYQAAIDYTKQSVLVAEKCNTNHSCNMLALVHDYYNLFYYYNVSGQMENKYAAIDSCIVYALKGNTGFDRVIPALTDKINYLFNKGEYSLCNKDAKLGVDIIQKYYHSKDSIEYIVLFVIKQAHCLYFSRDFSGAEKLIESKISQFKQTGNSNQLYAFYSLLASINNDKKNYTKALIYFQTAYQACLILKYKDGCAQNLQSIGLLYAKNFGYYDKGLKYCFSALKYADNASDSLYIFQQVGNIYTLKRMYDSAQYYFQKAFNRLKNGMNETTMLKNSFQFPGFNLLQNLSDLTTDKGNTYVKEYYDTKNKNFLKEALGIYKKDDIFLANIKTDQHLQFASNLVWRTTARSLYEHAIEACYADNNTDDAFYFFEKSRAVLLNDQINEQRWTADSDISKQAAVKQTIAELEQKLETVPTSSDDYLAIQKKLYTNNQQLIVLVDNIKNRNPLFYQNYLDTAFITITQLRKNILNDSKTLVEIYSGDSAVYVLTITGNNQSLSKINKQLYDSLTISFNSFIANRYLLNQHFKDFIQTAHQLYSLLFKNIIPSYGSIIISPDGKGYPFEALVMNNDDRNPDYFLNHYATSYTYSAKYLTNQFAANKTNSNTILGIAPVQYKNYQNLADLAGSDGSLKIINTYFSNTTNYTLDKATKNNFLQNFPNYNIVQLYTHASDSSINNDPVIYFSDSALYLSNLIPDRKPVTQLVILSACETANGKLYQGEGIFSFNRGFAALGIPAAISNLWSIDNQSTYTITELFYKYLAQGLATDIALQKAKLEFINNSTSEEKKLPYFWAGSILTGKVDIIKGAEGFSWMKLIVIMILSFAIIYFIRNIFIIDRSKSKAA